MITTPEDYIAMLHRIQDENFPRIALLLPPDENIYDIDLNTRTIELPEFLSVQKDHVAETIYFRVDRYFDHMDLSNTVCLIQYIIKNPDTGKEEGYLYPVPFYDTETLMYEDKMIFPWALEGNATRYAGDIQFAIRFYLVNHEGDKIVYNLNTLPHQSKILYGIDVTEDNEEYIFEMSVTDEIFAKIDELSRKDLYWIDLY